MKLLFFVFFATLALAATQLATAIVSYPDDTPTSAINQDMQDIVDAGGVISSQFDIYKGFSAQAPPDSLRSLSTRSTEYKPTIEADDIETAYNDEDENHASIPHKRQFIQRVLEIPKFRVGDKVYLFDRGFRDGPFLVASALSQLRTHTLSLEDGMAVRDGEEIHVDYLEGA